MEEMKKPLRVLTIGSSSSVDSNHMINLVSHAQGIDRELVIGTLYYSGCKLQRHVQYMNESTPAYLLYLSSTATPDEPPKILREVTMLQAVEYDEWDIIVLQAGGGELDRDETLTNGNIQAIQSYVNEHKRNPDAYFIWHFTCIPPADPELTAKYPYEPNPYRRHNEHYNFDREACFRVRAERIGRFIFTDNTFRYTVCSITAVQNACTSYLTEKDLYRDYTHSTDLARVMTASVWYCHLTGKTQLEAVKLDAIPKAFLKSAADKTQDRVLTPAEKAIVLESVNNALAHPLEITQSQYTQAPEK
jgi:hypothetical protein